MYIVNVKLPRDKEHDPRNKKTGACPVSPFCTDVTGEHHSFVDKVANHTPEVIREIMEEQGLHVTRIEEVR